MAQTLAEIYADFATGLKTGDIPAEVREAARWHIINSIGVSIAGANPKEDSGKAAAKLQSKWGDASGASLLGLGTRARPNLRRCSTGRWARRWKWTTSMARRSPGRAPP